MLFIFHLTSNQEGIKKAKNKIKAHLLEIRLYKDSLEISLKAQGKILLTNLKYISHSTKPMLVMFIPVILILVQLNFWFGYESLKPGESVILKVKLEPEYSALDTAISIDASPAIQIETSPLRIEEDSEINWRFSAKEKGIHNLNILIKGQKITKKISVDQRALSKISPLKYQSNFFKQLFYPAEAPIGKEFPVKSVEVTYPERRMNFLGLGVHWLIAYFALSIIFGFAFKGVFKVEI